MNECVLDASAILACINDEPGAQQVESLLELSVCKASAVNHAEALSRLCDWGMSIEEASLAIASLDLTVVNFDAEQARHCAALRSPTRHQGLSLGDRACLALARTLRCTAYTGDRPWLDLAAPLGLDIVCIRPDSH